MKRIKNKWLRIGIKSFLIFIVGFLFLINLFYINTTIYSFPEQKKFAGDAIYNPYSNLPENSYRANFHAHTVAWKEVTNGHNTEKEMFDEYSKRGYDIVGISNYHSISSYAKDKSDLYVPVYEHGYNIFKSHCLGINVDKVSYFDYPLIQSTSHKQKIIENIRANNGFVAIAHPKFAGGKTFSDMENLVHYDFIEVLNHYRISDEYWDKALSAGRLSWVMGNDDTHDLENEPTFKIWNIIHSEYRNSDSIMNSMQAGKNYGVLSKNQKWDNRLVSLEMLSPNAFQVLLETKADSIQFIGQNGKKLKTIVNSITGSYEFKKPGTYVRTVVYNANSSLYLNPLVRFDGKNIPLTHLVSPEINWILTWLARLFFILIGLSFVFLIRKIVKS